MKNSNKFINKGLYEAPCLVSLKLDLFSSLCQSSPVFGDENEAGSVIDIDDSFDF